MEEKVKCRECGFETNASLVCYECEKVTRAYREWFRHLNIKRKHHTENEIRKAAKSMESKMLEIKKRTLKEWGI